MTRALLRNHSSSRSINRTIAAAVAVVSSTRVGADSSASAIIGTTDVAGATSADADSVAAADNRTARAVISSSRAAGSARHSRR